MNQTDQLSALPARTRRRVTRRLIPYLMFIYLLAYLDRANVGVAKLQMQKDLDFNDAVIGFGAGIFSTSGFFSRLPSPQASQNSLMNFSCATPMVRPS